MSAESNFSADDLSLLSLVLKNRSGEVAHLLTEKSFAADILGEALVLAAWRGKTELVGQLLGAGAPIDARGYRGKTPLAAAFGEGKLGLSQALLDQGASDPGGRVARALSRSPADKKLFQAVRKKDLPGIDVALGEGAALCGRDPDGSTVLSAAASRGAAQVIRHLFAAQRSSSTFAADDVYRALSAAAGNEEVRATLVGRLRELGIGEADEVALHQRWVAAARPLYEEPPTEQRLARDREIHTLITASRPRALP